MTEATGTKNPLLPLLVPGDHGRTDALPTLAALFADAPMAVAVLEGGSLVHGWANGRWLARLPTTMGLHELVGQSLASVLVEGEGELLALVRRAMSTGQPQRFKGLHVHGLHGEAHLDGVALPFAGRVVLQVQETRPEKAAIGTFAEQVLEQIPHPVVVLSRTGRVLRANNKARTRFGVEEGQRGGAVLGAIELLDEHGRPVQRESMPILQALAGETVEMRGSVRDRLLGERRDCILYGGPVVQDGRISASLVSLIDVTELRRLERAKDEFLNIAAHELKTPLTAVRAYLQLALRKGLSNPASDPMVQNALAGTYRMQRLIADMLDSARLETGRLQLQLERVDLGKIVMDVEERFRRHVEDGRSIEVRVESPLELEGDPVRLDQIVGNLLSNALRHGPPGEPVRLVARREGGCAVVEVEDRGEGVPPEYVPRIFERLFRGASAKGDGLGLGLFIARELSELHGGHLGVDPRPGRGARFFLRLPLP